MYTKPNSYHSTVRNKDWWKRLMDLDIMEMKSNLQIVNLTATLCDSVGFSEILLTSKQRS